MKEAFAFGSQQPMRLTLLCASTALLWVSTASAQWWFAPDKWAKPDGTKEELEADAAECKA